MVIRGHGGELRVETKESEGNDFVTGKRCLELVPLKIATLEKS